MRLGRERRPFIGVWYVSHCMESITALFDEVLHCLWVRAEEYKLLDDSVDQLFELWGASQERRVVDRESGLTQRWLIAFSLSSGGEERRSCA